MVFFGYFLNSIVLMQFAWSFWIPLATLSLCVLSVRMIETYQSIVKKNFHKTMEDSKFKKLMIFVHSLCFIEAILDWMGTLVGDILTPGNIILQTLFYSLWKFIAVILFTILNYFIFKICQRCYQQLGRKMSSVGDFHSKTNSKLRYGFFKLLFLFIIFLFLIILLSIQAIIELISVVKQEERSFIEEPILAIVFIYLPLWSLISIVTLIYAWVNSKDLKKNSSEHSKSSKNISSKQKIASQTSYKDTMSITEVGSQSP